LSGQCSHVLIDERAHHSLLDAALFFEAPCLKFKHRDVRDLASVVRRYGKNAKLIVLTDGMFTHNGTIAPLGEYLNVLPQDALILLDDAHGAGVLGATGKGTIEEQRVPRGQIIQTISLGKAFGTYGGVILASRPLSQ